MKNDWILDVLADLRAYALENAMPALSEQLGDARLIAANEIAALRNGPGQGKAAHDRRQSDAARRAVGEVGDGN
jgi:hypothetical protein